VTFIETPPETATIGRTRLLDVLEALDALMALEGGEAGDYDDSVAQAYAHRIWAQAEHAIVQGRAFINWCSQK
jgi:hypothetical protein